VNQRREHVRVNAFGQIDFTRGSQKLRGKLLDLSGGGFSAITRGVELGESLECVLTLPSGLAIGATARAVRCLNDDCLGFEFVQIASRDREQVVREVFRLQRLALARGVKR